MKKTIWTVAVLCLTAVLLCTGVCLTTAAWVHRETAALTEAAAVPLGEAAPAGGYETAAYVSPAAPASAPAAALSATEIYDLACRQVVGISTTVTGYNMFGQLSSSAVSGTGFILSEDGYILTNYHVVEDARRSGADVTVMLYDGSEYPAEIVGVEGTRSDIALLKIEAEGLTPVTLGNSDEMKVGEQAYVVGNPLGELTYTLTSGIISALDREIATERNVRVSMFQLDAAVNSGNSGGPVYNDRGEVIGVVTAKYKAAGIEGLGFAIPVNEAKAIAESILENGYVAGKPYFGIIVTNLDEAQAEAQGTIPGVYVHSVDDGSCAEKAGIMAGDVIVEMDGRAVGTKEEVAAVKLDYKAGDECSVKLYRDGEYRTVTVVFDEEPREGLPEVQIPQPEETPRSELPEGWSFGGEGTPFSGSFEDWMNEFFGGFFDYFGGSMEDGEAEAEPEPEPETPRRGFRHFG